MIRTAQEPSLWDRPWQTLRSLLAPLVASSCSATSVDLRLCH